MSEISLGKFQRHSLLIDLSPDPLKHSSKLLKSERGALDIQNIVCLWNLKSVFRVVSVAKETSVVLAFLI